MKKTHCDIILEALADGKWHNVLFLMECICRGGQNVAIRSRVSDLRHKGHNIESEIDTNGQAKYRLVKERPSYNFDGAGQGLFL